MATYYFQASCCGQQSCGVCVAIWLALSGFTPQDCDNSLQSFTDLRQCYYVAVGYLSSARPDAMTEQPTHVLPGFSRLDKQFRLSKAFDRHQSAHFAGLGMGLCASVSWVMSLTPFAEMVFVDCGYEVMKFYFHRVWWKNKIIAKINLC